jgi:predicted enzyme related to lactoylglutathione lyase
MIWRRVRDLDSAKKLAGELLGFEIVGEDAYSAMFDGRNVLLGLWQQDVEALAADDACSELSFLKYRLVSNPVSEMILTGPSFQALAKRVSADDGVTVPHSISKTQAGSKLPFFDRSGNLTALYSPSKAVLRTKAGMKLQSLADSERVSVVGHNLTTTNLTRSRDFYSETLGLQALKTSRSRVEFDLGNLILALEPQSEGGLVERARKAGRLQGNWLVFHVDDVTSAMRALSGAGIEFPKGIETSGVGATAYFEDPDGHPLVLWEPSGGPTDLQPINFYPVLDRILADGKR